MEIVIYQGDLLCLCLWLLVFSLEGPSFSASCCCVCGLPDRRERGRPWAPSCLWGSHTGSRFAHLLCTGALQIMHVYSLIPHLCPGQLHPSPLHSRLDAGESQVCVSILEKGPSARSLFVFPLPAGQLSLVDLGIVRFNTCKTGLPFLKAA